MISALPCCLWWSICLHCSVSLYNNYKRVEQLVKAAVIYYYSVILVFCVRKNQLHVQRVFLHISTGIRTVPDTALHVVRYRSHILRRWLCFVSRVTLSELMCEFVVLKYLDGGASISAYPVHIRISGYSTFLEHIRISSISYPVTFLEHIRISSISYPVAFLEHIQHIRFSYPVAFSEHIRISSISYPAGFWAGYACF